MPVLKYTCFCVTARLIKVVHKRHLTKEDLVKVYVREAALFASAELFYLLAMT